MPTKTNNENIFKINVNTNTKSVDELLDEGKSLHEINEIIKPNWQPIEKFEFVEGEVETGKKYYEEEIKPLLRKSYTATLSVKVN